MKALTLLYHDVVEKDLSTSGFPGIGADRYKFVRDEFEAHLEAISSACPLPATSVLAHAKNDTRQFHLTFDDGGTGSLLSAAMLERKGWMGHYFIATDYVGKPGFLTPTEIRALHDRGHVIGSHSCSHPDRIDELPDDALRREWAESADIIADMIGLRPQTASIPCGTYSRRVAEAAASVGYRHLFTSEPVTESWRIAECMLHGRLSIVRGTTPNEAGALASGQLSAIAAQYAAWNAKKLIKNTARPVWNMLRRRALRARAGV